ncbi:hypothetical protein [Sphingosinicella terrae]|uniref:hypothetical protein n=1 Tax=Sphingosinicella terrae TaxID=2172047 RepID=UPI002548F0A7|nr:hypothetical protein [Sphingosinicella terrae]
MIDARQEEVARACLDGAYDDSLSFPQGVQALGEAGFEAYLVDYRTNTRAHYRPDGETLVLDNPHRSAAVDADFDQPAIAAAIRWAQLQPPDYSYAGFNRVVTAAGCAGYFVSLSGRRVVYFGRTGEIHVEHFPAIGP